MLHRLRLLAFSHACLLRCAGSHYTITLAELVPAGRLLRAERRRQAAAAADVADVEIVD
jgi:hypothetical protein